MRDFDSIRQKEMGSFENRVRHIYNRGYEDGYKDGREKSVDERVYDCISREDALMALTGEWKEPTDELIHRFIRRIKALQSVTPAEKVGHWEWAQYDSNPNIGNWHCSECRCVVVECVDKNEKGGILLYKYCPNCGAKMIEPQESEG